MYFNIGEREIAFKRILSIFIDLELNYDNDYYISSYDNLTVFLSNLTDKEILIKLFNYLFFNIPRQTETEKKFMYYISIISILEALNEDRYFFKFKRLFKIDYIPDEIKSQILAYYQRIFVIKDKSEKRKILFMQSLVWETEFEDKDLVFKNPERIRDILNLFSSVDKILGKYE
jgi:hypothetical protein